MDISWLGKNSYRISDELVDVIVNPDNNDIDTSSFTENTVLISTDNDKDFPTSLTLS